MKITNNNGISNSEHSHLLLDSSLLVEGQVCEAISLVSNVKESETRTGNPYVSFTLLDKHAGVINASMFGINKKEYSTKLMKSFNKCIVYIKGDVVKVRGKLSINLISIDEWEDSVFTINDFTPKLPELGHEKDEFDLIIDGIESVHEELKAVTQSIRKLNLRDIMAGTCYLKGPGVMLGDLLKVSNMTSKTILNSGTGNDLINSSTALIAILYLGLKHYIVLDSDKQGRLVKNNMTNQIKLAQSLIDNHKIFGNSNISEALVTEYTHLGEVMSGVIEPVTYTSKVVPGIIKSNWSILHYGRLNEISIIDNEYNYGGEEFTRLM